MIKNIIKFYVWFIVFSLYIYLVVKDKNVFLLLYFRFKGV